MVIHIVKNVKMNRYTYSVDENNNYHVEASYSFGIIPRTIKVISDNVSLLILKQEQWLCKLLTLIPIFWFFHTETFPKCFLYKDNKKIGEAKSAFCTPKRKFVINDSIYEIYLHNNNFVSIMKDDVQIALIKRDALSVNERGYYTVKYDEKAEIDFSLILMFVAFTDIDFFNSHFRFDSIRYEKTIGKDRYKDRTLWEPM